MGTSSGDESEFHTDPENPMLGPDGKLRDAADKPDQFVFSPSDVQPSHPSNSEGYNPDNDLPAAHRVAQRPKRVVKHITRENPIEAFEQQKLSAKNKNKSSAFRNKDLGIGASQKTLAAFSKNGLQLDNPKLPSNAKRPIKSIYAGMSGDSSTSDGELTTEQSTKRGRHQVKKAPKRARIDNATKALKPLSAPENAELGGGAGVWEEDAPGANENQDEFACKDAQAALAVKQSQKARRMQDLETVFTEVIHDDQGSYRVCRVCQ
ncbi:uncharacterized protein EI90DRAFT_3022766 [Cantharellus anzutake]|uniref:uncharacterized protein n=1 Tax=Cantharellus anzutake TaxID=1750568 RepID=UPI001907A5A5|nr:uncharacterized protein EI90DRAFT_3022766 [Cantharellus anzutake]KAF8313166.1 hypothetical protein EI90DRAFT_3022766 [Cantharellus anzutake]